MQIAALLDGNGGVAGFEQGGVLRIYDKTDGVWAAARELPYSIEGLEQPDAFRRRLTEVCEWLGPCRTLIARRFRGTHRVVLEHFSLEMWEMADFSERYLDAVEEFQAQEFAARAAAKDGITENQTGGAGPEEVLPQPVQTEPGIYSLDLTEVMSHPGTHNSQKALLPFLQKGGFDRLEVNCPHTPKWLAGALPSLGLRADEAPQKDGVRLVLTPGGLDA